MKKLLFLSIDPVEDRTQWSGIPFSVLQELKKYYNVDVRIIKKNWLCLLESLCLKILRTMMLSRTHIRGIYKCVYYSKQSAKIIRSDNYDVVFTLTTLITAFIPKEIKTPIFVYIDATNHVMTNYYWKSNFIADLTGNYLEKKSLNRNTINITSSNWSRNDMVNYYQINGEKCCVCLFGANIETEPYKSVKDIDTINLLFIGIDWKRKGAKIAIDCIKYLNRYDKTHKYSLSIVGCNLPFEITEDNIKVYGSLNRNIKEQRDKLEEIRSKADIFILPTKAECAGIVFCESSAYSLPILTFDTGGIGDYVINDYNGYRLPISSKGEDFAKKIMEILAINGKLELMGKNGRTFYQEKLNWEACGKEINNVIRNHC
jgi:glycosyltransferase involved in cell wall biosynthesis